jgi:hypothetical protein
MRRIACNEEKKRDAPPLTLQQPASRHEKISPGSPRIVIFRRSAAASRDRGHHRRVRGLFD